MQPGVSAEDCLYADLGVDPSEFGSQSYEGTDFIVNARKVDTTAALIIWQIAVVGDLTFRVLEPDPRRLAVLEEVLLEDYPPDHSVIVYEAATLPVTEAKQQTLPLGELHTARCPNSSTLYIPPLARPRPSPARLALLKDRLG